jgi:hypothetical protein
MRGLLSHGAFQKYELRMVRPNVRTNGNAEAV